jgi:hypothetical protein
LSKFSVGESLCGGSDSREEKQNPSPIFIVALVNRVKMKIMFDSGSTKSFIQEAALHQTPHLPINSQRYDCYTLKKERCQKKPFGFRGTIPYSGEYRTLLRNLYEV